MILLYSIWGIWSNEIYKVDDNENYIATTAYITWENHKQRSCEKTMIYIAKVADLPGCLLYGTIYQMLRVDVNTVLTNHLHTLT